MTSITRLPTLGRRGLDSFSVALITEAASFGVLIDAFRSVEAGHGENVRCFLTLDDVGQCLYTSGHARNRTGLSEGVEYPDDDSPAAGADYDTALFRAAAAMLGETSRTRSWDAVCGSLAVDPADLNALVELNRSPELVLDEVHVVQCLPSTHDGDLLANLPNGYFESDWDPFACHTIIGRLCTRHGFRLLGIGASTLGFIRTSPLDPTGLEALMADLRSLYGHPDASAWRDLNSTLAGSLHLLLGYTEDFADLLG